MKEHDATLQTEAMLQIRTGLTSLRLEPLISAWVHAGTGSALSKMTALQRLSINPGTQVERRPSSSIASCLHSCTLRRLLSAGVHAER